MLEQQLLNSVPGLQLSNLTLNDQEIMCELAATANVAACPICAQLSQHVHSRYYRHPADLPWSDRSVHYSLLVRRFFCDNPTCLRRIFSERFGPALRAYARRTTVLTKRLQELGLTTGGAVGAALASLVGTPISPSTVLRLVRATDLPPLPTPRVLSMDDFAFRKGQTYGTILVDLERHYPVDLLADREPQTVTKWLLEHPGVEIISRDRASCYAQASSDGAPDAVQVADRYHLFANLGDALQRLLDRQPGVLEAVTEQLAQGAVAEFATLAATVLPEAHPHSNTKLGKQEPHNTDQGSPAALCATPTQTHLQPVDATTIPTPTVEPVTTASSATPTATPAVQRRFTAIKELQTKGYGQREIAKRLNLHRRTVRRYMLVEQPPMRAYGPQHQSKAGAYLPYLRRRWAEGCHNAVMLWAELQEQGFKGSYSSIYRLLVRCIGQPNGVGSGANSSSAKKPSKVPKSGVATEIRAEPKEVKPLTARAARWLLCQPPRNLSVEEEQRRALLCRVSTTIATAYDLAQRFGVLIRERQPEGLASWLNDAKKSGVAELRNFAIGIERDQAAVLGAMSQPWSQGQTEGQVNRLKFIKRAGYGRMKFDLLRLRVLHRPIRQRIGSDHQK